MSVVYPCIVCESNITGRSHAIQCDVCDHWQHRKCNTGVTHIQYRQLQRKEITLDWSCGQCRSVETRNDDDDVQPSSPPTSHPCETLELPPRPHIPDLMQDDEPTRIPDTSFNVSCDIGSLPMIQDEELEDRPPSPVDAPDGPVTYEVLEGGTHIGARMLLGSDGFTYNVKRENKSTGFIYWVCSVRSKANRCPAWVKEYGASRVSGYIPHNHPADPTKAGKLRTSVLAKTKAAASLSRPAGQVVKKALRELKDVNAKPSNLPGKPSVMYSNVLSFVGVCFTGLSVFIARFKLKQVSSTCGFHTVSSLCFHTTNKAQKVKVSLSPQMLAKKKKKLDKILAKYEKSSDRILKPIEENEVSVLLKREIRAGTREREKIVYTSEELESHVLLEKNWARYKMKTHLTDLRTCTRMKAAQEKALNKLLEESSELYQQAIQCDDSLFPYTFKGPLKTPPKINYDAADGSYIDRTNYFDVDCGIFDDASLFERKKKVKK